MKITGIIRTVHDAPECVAASVAADNLSEMVTRPTTYEGTGVVETTITGTKIRSIIASMDDYLSNLTVAEELCKQSSDKESEH